MKNILAFVSACLFLGSCDQRAQEHSNSSEVFFSPREVGSIETLSTNNDFKILHKNQKSVVIEKMVRSGYPYAINDDFEFIPCIELFSVFTELSFNLKVKNCNYSSNIISTNKSNKQFQNIWINAESGFGERFLEFQYINVKKLPIDQQKFNTYLLREIDGNEIVANPQGYMKIDCDHPEKYYFQSIIFQESYFKVIEYRKQIEEIWPNSCR